MTIHRSAIVAGALWAAIAASVTTAGANSAGYNTYSFEAPHHGRAVSGAIWYPAEDNGEHIVIGENAVFHGVTVARDATLLDGQHPLVLLSHGLGGTFRSLSWLASGLAQRGAVVLALNHPNSTWGDFDLEAGLAHWTRVADFTVALNELLSDPRFQSQLDESRIMATGFSYGGWTALSMGGLTGNLEGYAAHCESYGERSSHCHDLMVGGIDLTDVSEANWNASYSDPRITHITAIDPGLIWGLAPHNASALPQTVRLIALGEGSSRLLATDFDASGLASMLPDAQISRLAPASHFTVLPPCKPMGAAILADEQDDPVCTDPQGTDRPAVHARIIEIIASDLGL